MNKVNYQKQLEDILRRLPEENSGCHDPQAVPVSGKKKLLIHSCCAPCSSYVLEYLRDFFDITVLYYNPNITDRQEYEKRTAEQKRLIEEMNREAPSFITMETGRYEPEVFLPRRKVWNRFLKAVKDVSAVMKSVFARLQGLPGKRALTTLPQPSQSAL